MLLRVSRVRRVETIWPRSESEATGAVMTWAAFGDGPKAEPKLGEPGIERNLTGCNAVSRPEGIYMREKAWTN